MSDIHSDASALVTRATPRDDLSPMQRAFLDAAGPASKDDTITTLVAAADHEEIAEIVLKILRP